jgi:hypothetical protein
MATPVPIARIVEELEKLKIEMDAGNLKHSEYDQRLARILQELRERGVDGDRAKVTAALDDLTRRAVITPGVRDHLEKRLGLK